MEKAKVYISAGVFVALTAAKLLLPGHAAALRERVVTLVSRDDDYSQLVETMGSRLSEGGLGEGLIAVLRPEPEPEEAVDAYQPTTVPQTPAPQESEEPEITVETAAYSATLTGAEALPVPENVRTDRPELPFDTLCPVAGGRSSGFGWRLHPTENILKFHYGTDFAADAGDAVLAFADGYVYAVGSSEGYGNYLILTHQGGFSTIYAHLSAVEVTEGDMVSRGQEIGLVGETGRATGPHLHFELLDNDVYCNPEYYL